MKKLLSFILFCFFTFSFYSCYYDKADLLYPVGVGSPCDTAGIISYTQKVVPLLQSQCYGCHNAAGASGGIVMGTYTADKVLATNGKLHGSISYAAGVSPMPKGMTKMTSCQIATIKKWVDGGALNN